MKSLRASLLFSVCLKLFAFLDIFAKSKSSVVIDITQDLRLPPERKELAKGLIYIYNTSDWHKVALTPLFPRHKDEKMDIVLNGGAGPAVDRSSSIYHTDQYQLFQLVYNRALKDPRRTLDPSKATTFIIPYDFASDVAFMRYCKNNNVCFDFRKCPQASEVTSLLQESPWFLRNGGSDHLLLVGMNYAMDHYILKPKCKAFLSGVCRNCTKLAIDDYSYLYGTPEEGISARGDYWHAVPFPSDFHWTTKSVRPFPWENTNRPIIASYIGSSKSYYGPARKIRGSIIHFCEAHPIECRHQTYGLNGTRERFHVDGHNPHRLSVESVFCFQPIGDLMTRKGLFDGILMGCIPVTFDPLTASVMYTWHWSEEFWKAVSVELPHIDVAHRKLDPVQYLIDMYRNDLETVRKKQFLLRAKAFELQYSLDGRSESEPAGHRDGSSSTWPEEDLKLVTFQPPSPQELYNCTSPNSLLVDYYANRTTASKLKNAVHPMRDAYDIAMDHILGWHSRQEPDVRLGTVPECWGGYVNKTLNKCVPGKEPEGY